MVARTEADTSWFAFPILVMFSRFHDFEKRRWTMPAARQFKSELCAVFGQQGVIGIQLWTGLEPSPAVIGRALEEVFNS